MPKLFWKPRNEEIIHISRPPTRGNLPGHQIFHIQEESNTVPDNGNQLRRSRDPLSQDLDKPQNTWQNTQKYQNNWENNQNFGGSLSALRVRVNAHPETELRERDRNIAEENDFSPFQFPDDLSRRESLILRNDLASTSQNVHLNDSSPLGFPCESFGLNLSRESGVPQAHIIGFDVDLDDDITRMAAQRDQQRGSTIKFNRGMMGPILSKDDENQLVNSTRRLGISTRFRSEPVLDLNEAPPFEPPEVRGIFREPVSSPPHCHLQETYPFHLLRAIGDGCGPPRKRTPHEDFLNDFNGRDIMAQSIRRQSLKSSKFRPLNIREEEDPYNRVKLGIKSPSNFTVFQPEPKPYQGNMDRQTPFAGEVPSNHDDVQILNLQGFMDSSMRGQSSAPRAKSRRSNVRRVDDTSPVDSTRRVGRARRKKKSKQSNKCVTSSLDESDEVVLKDIDDIDEKMASLVVGPKSSFKDNSGRPITFDEAIQLRQLLTGNSMMALPKEWLEQSFIQNKNLNLSYGLIQKKGGPCGVLASVQAHLLKSLIYGSRVSPDTSPASPLRPSTREWSWALSAALAEILWRISNSEKAVLALPGSLSSHFDHGIGRYTPDGLTETLNIYEFSTSESLFTAVENHLQVFTTNVSSGCVLFLYSAILTRGLDNVAVDMDNGSGYLINGHGYASQEVVNLLLTGQATTNTFDGEQTFGEEAPSGVAKNFSIESVMENIDLNLRNIELNDKMVFRGIRERSDIGLLSLFEHYGSCKVGNHLKSPEYPVWVICSESHYSVAFARDQNISRDEPPQDIFDIYYYDGLGLQEDEIRLTIDLTKEPKVSDPAPPLELCLRTKWPNSHISWNGTEPIL